MDRNWCFCIKSSCVTYGHVLKNNIPTWNVNIFLVAIHWNENFVWMGVGPSLDTMSYRETWSCISRDGRPLAGLMDTSSPMANHEIIKYVMMLYCDVIMKPWNEAFHFKCMCHVDRLIYFLPFPVINVSLGGGGGRGVPDHDSQRKKKKHFHI